MNGPSQYFKRCVSCVWLAPSCFTTNFEEVSAAGGHAKFVMLVNAVQIEESDEL